MTGTALSSSRSALSIVALALTLTDAQTPPVPYRDAAQGLWGYRHQSGRVVIPPRFLGAGDFHGRTAPIEDRDGFAVIDEQGHVVERISTDTLPATSEPAPPPDARCAWSPAERYPSTALVCYIQQLRGSGPEVGGRLTRRPPGGESASSAVILKFATGVVVYEDIGYEGFKRRVLLPGVSREQAADWRQFLYPDRPVKMGCSESWQSGAVAGGAFIEQHAGC